MPRQDVPGGNLRTLAAFLFVILPALIFYAVLIRLSYNLPLMDDYHALLNPVDGLLQVSGTRSKIAYFFAAQHNEYKLWLDIAVAWAQVKLFGRMNFQALCLVGDSFVLGLGLVLWRLFPLRQNNLATRLMWFAPASWLLFQLSYAETLNWAMAGLQNLPVVLFSFIALMLLMDVRWVCFAGAVACLVLAVASSGNGFLLLVVGGLALIMQRRYAHLASWFIAGAALLKLYAYHFNVLSSQAAAHRSIFVTLRHFSLAYTLAMMGSEGTHFGSIVLGLMLCIFNGYLLWTGYFRRHAAIGYCTLFIVLTAIGVGGIRSELGLAQAISSRYHIYCLLLLILAWFAVVERLRTTAEPQLARRLLAAAILVTVLFAAWKDRWGYRFLREREQYTQSGMEAYRHSLTDGGTLGPIFWVASPNPFFEATNPSARATLNETLSKGVYVLPK